MTEVVAALIWRENTFMICRRPPHKARGLLWEFVGGKIESGETPKVALIRECREELGVTIEPKALFMDVVHHYPDLDVHLSVYNATITSGRPKLLEHVEIKYITPEQISRYAFCPADVDILQKIKSMKGN